MKKEEKKKVNKWLKSKGYDKTISTIDGQPIKLPLETKTLCVCGGFKEVRCSACNGWRKELS